MLNTIFFDLDGTLLNLSQDTFMEVYVKELVMFAARYGHKPEDVKKGLFYGMKLMFENDGQRSNENCFWDGFAAILGEKVRGEKNDYMHFYENEFNVLKRVTSYNERMKECIDGLKKKGYTLLLATNPLFPKEATFARTRWANLEVEDFVRITTYENSTYCKPKLAYFEENLVAIGKRADECLMVGNNVSEDMVAEQLGFDTYLITDILENDKNLDISKYKQGSAQDAIVYLNALPAL